MRFKIERCRLYAPYVGLMPFTFSKEPVTLVVFLVTFVMF